ncbi:hypothetical protein LX70_02510 [Defluviimonas denitrificans]|jgi:hypothetical protein|uniref:Uncharacterized protein n=1 Tax=Albidovulum denitrificans TaxID=404881 RepID=A0A2S8S624_9RHOB|nr:hypothetical protein [Defluviimonas denitrificans]PQV56245.1 hypothetical protein LX70_02510 [Defluviimonas denitrificans]
MLAAQRRNGLLSEFVRAVFSIGRVFSSALPGEPAPYWTDYLRETDHKKD